ncbi:MAG: Histidine kinase [Pedosphaera sp.]|nr:Histidine kinase [Pedosphaera sp.]
MSDAVMRKIPTSLVLCLAGIWLLVARACGFESGLTETESSVRTWRSTEGLPADSVIAIIQTRDGYLWVGTSAGLVRFDGVKFTETKLINSSTNLPIRVTALCEDSNGHLWIGTQQDGLFELAKGTVRQYTKARGLLDDSVTSLAADSQGSVWIGTKSGLNLVTGKEFKSFTMRDGLPDELVSSVHVARSGTVWITTRGGLCRFLDGHITQYALQTESQGRSPEYLGAYEDRRGNLWAFGDTYLINLAGGKRFNYFRGNEAASVRIWSLCEGRDGRLWIGTSGRGLFCFDDNRFQPVILGELRSPYDVRAICEDREGNLWLGTSGGGLVQMRLQPVHSLRIEQGLPSGAATALALDASGRVHVGLARGGLFVGEAGRFERLGNGGSRGVQGFVSALSVARDGTVWAGTLGGGLYGLLNGRGFQLTTANGLADNAVLSVCVDVEESVWAGTRAGTVHRFTGQTTTRYDISNGLPGSPVTVLVPSSSGGLWVGTEDGSILHGEQDRFMPAQSVEKVGHHPIIALHEDKEGRLWAGTAGGGLACLMKGARVNWNSGNGLPNDFVCGIVEDAKQNIWLATGAGIYRISRNTIQKSLNDPRIALACELTSDAKTTYDPATVFGGTRALLSPEGTLWFATAEGVLNVNTRQPEIEPASLPVYIESVAFNGQPPVSVLRGAAWSSAVSDSAPAIVRGDLRSLEIYFTALNFSAPEKVRFRHKLEGFDPDWIDDGTGRVARYGRLPYGHYELRVAARKVDGIWQEATTTFPLEVPTPLYFRPWAIFLYVISAVVVVAGIVRVVSHRRLRSALAQLEQQQLLERERMRIARDMHDEIGSKLTKISFLSEHAKVDSTASGPLAGQIESIAETSRELLQTMDEIVWVVNPRNDTLEHLAAYLSQHAVEYFQNTSVECDLRLPRAIPHFPLSSEARHNLFLAFEEALNNVLKHSAATAVKVEMIVNPADCEINITDNGRGFEVPGMVGLNASPRATNGGNGLKNMRQRLADIGGECRICSQPGEGSTISMSIRLNQNSTRKP